MRQEILSTAGRVFYFPVRHHSPAAARLVEQYILREKPGAVLIEGPSDFNPHMSQLALPHRLPIAIYSYTAIKVGEDEHKLGVFYPFCEYSPEWCAVQAGRQIGVPVAFIDVPWSSLAVPTARRNRYSDASLARSGYIEALCRKVGVESFHAFWDSLVEIDDELSLQEYLRRCHTLCYHMRLADGAQPEDIEREQFMAEQIQRALDAIQGQIFVVTGGFHSYALFARLNGIADTEFRTAGLQRPTEEKLLSLLEKLDRRHDPESEDLQTERSSDLEEAVETETVNSLPITETRRGISLTPYSYERLDSLKGYESGMPGPGFYHQIFIDRKNNEKDTYRKLLYKAVELLRAKKQQISSADLLAVELSAAGLAAIRAHKHIWRQDLVDAIIGSLIKDEMTTGLSHPLLEAVHDALRGDNYGKLAEGTNLPPLVDDIAKLLISLNIAPPASKVPLSINLDLQKPEDRKRSNVLHQIRCLALPGFILGTDANSVFADENTGAVIEHWTLIRDEKFDAACIEAAVYGGTLSDASALCLVEKCGEAEGDADTAASLLVDACLMGFGVLSVDFHNRLYECMQTDSDLLRMTDALRSLLFLYRYDDILEHKPVESIGSLLKDCFERAIWLLDFCGAVDQSIGLILQTILETFERCHRELNLDRTYFIEVLNRVRRDNKSDALLRGAATGALWTLDEAPPEAILSEINLFAAPQLLGNFLTGLFLLAREASKHKAELILKIDQLIMTFSTEEYLEALPHLRLAFSLFTPREKDHIARLILMAQGNKEKRSSSQDSAIHLDVAATTMLVEERLRQTLRRYGLRRLVDE